MSKKTTEIEESLPGGPVGPRILVKIKSKLEEITKAGLVVPTESTRRDTFDSTRGTVVKMGPDCYNEVFKAHTGAVRPWCEVGDEILFRSHASLFPNDCKNGLVLITDDNVLWNFSKE